MSPSGSPLEALAKDYGIDLALPEPTYKVLEKDGDKIILTFDHVGSGLETFDVREPIGFAIAGSDQKFAWAKAKLVDKNKVEVWAEGVSEPVAVRYAWADNPVCNVYSHERLPVTPFRTDDMARCHGQRQVTSAAHGFASHCIPVSGPWTGPGVLLMVLLPLASLPCLTNFETTCDRASAGPSVHSPLRSGGSTLSRCRTKKSRLRRSP